MYVTNIFHSTKQEDSLLNPHTMTDLDINNVLSYVTEVKIDFQLSTINGL